MLYQASSALLKYTFASMRHFSATSTERIFLLAFHAYEHNDMTADKRSVSCFACLVQPEQQDMVAEPLFHEVGEH